MAAGLDLDSLHRVRVGHDRLPCRQSLEHFDAHTAPGAQRRKDDRGLVEIRDDVLDEIR